MVYGVQGKSFPMYFTQKLQKFMTDAYHLYLQVFNELLLKAPQGNELLQFFVRLVSDKSFPA
jgi:hypothetical protein